MRPVIIRETDEFQGQSATKFIENLKLVCHVEPRLDPRLPEQGRPRTTGPPTNATARERDLGSAGLLTAAGSGSLIGSAQS